MLRADRRLGELIRAQRVTEGLASMNVFLRLNGRRLAVPEVGAAIEIRQLAAGALGEATLAEWV